ncbi:MAG: HAMP domain-containing sensor histidine kinase [Turneriella sp.]
MKPLRKNLSQFSLFSGWALVMAVSMLSVVVLLVWWQRLLVKNLDLQYGFFRSEIESSSEVSPGLRRYLSEQDDKLAKQLFGNTRTEQPPENAAQLIEDRLRNRHKMVLYEQIFFIVLLLSGHVFFLYIYFRERIRRRLTEETILLATHELRQPLQSLSLALETVAPNAKGRSRDAIQTGLTEIGKLSQQIRWLASTFSAVHSTEDRTSITDLEPYVQSLLADDFSAADRQRVKVHAVHTSATELRIAPGLLHFVLRNLLENALKYSEGDVTIAAAPAGKKVEFRIAGRGKTMNQQEFRRIGGIFYRSNRADVQNTSGFGLGLYLTSRIVRRARGRLLLEHDKQGTTTAILTLRIN